VLVGGELGENPHPKAVSLPCSPTSLGLKGHKVYKNRIFPPPYIN